MSNWNWFILAFSALSGERLLRFSRKSGTIIIKIAVIVLVTFCLTELSFRIYNYFDPSFIFYSNSYDRYRGKPHSKVYDFRLNSLGFKDKEFGPKKADVYRIIGIGDSFTFGVVPYKYNYLTVLESNLKKDNYNIEILNMGIPSIGPKEYLALFVREGLKLKPDMLLLTFYIGNDYFDCLEHEKLYEYSYVATFINYLITIGTKYKGKIYAQGTYYDDKPTIDKKEYLEILEHRSFIYIKGNGRLAKLDKIAFHYLSMINDICKRRHIKFVVVIAPDEIQISRNLQEEVIKDYYPKLKEDQWDITQPNRLLIDELDKLGVKYINLYPYFAKKTGERLYVPQNTHWNIAGNRLAANVIQAYMVTYLNNHISKSP